MKIIEGGVTAAKGFLAGSAMAEIRQNKYDDMAFVASEKPCVTAGTFTTNRVFAAPVKWDRDVVKNSPMAQCMVINSGIANACTGAEGDAACEAEARALGETLNIPYQSVLIGSTGVIGMQLPVDKMVRTIRENAGKLKETADAGTKAARAIMTTDTHDKQAAVQIEIGGKMVTVGGMCKGAGMIHPHMCTMIACVTTDAMITKELLQKAQSESVDDSYNMISVDGDMSTNDTAVVLANGMAENPLIKDEGEDYQKFFGALKYVNTELAKQIAGDGEGCTCLFEAKIIGASDREQARTLAKSIIQSNLTKAAVFGHDANWGRILCAMGYSGAEFDPDKIDIWLESSAGKLKIVENGVATDYSETKATEIMSQNPVTAIADIKEGGVSATAWGCDLTFDYVKINADYRS
ncbi:MAG: bifunctional glutamate N-acetyltransferase/amino-acid acetyltransferase ArgJ [Lachnospiraceae bacterium]|jgi:glutamate N-acetyltransferase/amino-acid N-acetyltransferase